jgi:hypothetical protein
MEQNDGAGGQPLPDTRSNHLRSRSSGIPNSDRPAKDLIAQTPCGPVDERISKPVWRPEDSGPAADCLENRLVSDLDFFLNGSRPHQVQFAMTLGVISDLVSKVRNASRQIRVASHVVSNQEECGRHPLMVKDLKNALRGGPVWTVVKGQVHVPAACRAAADGASPDGTVGMVCGMGGAGEGRGAQGARRDPGAHCRTLSYTPATRLATSGHE